MRDRRRFEAFLAMYAVMRVVDDFVDEDLQLGARGRIYLPASGLAKAGFSEQEFRRLLLSGAADERWPRLVAGVVRQARPLEVAISAGVRKFVYVSVVNGPNLCDLDIVRAHEDFVDELRGSGIEYAVLRPTGYFSDMGEVLKMARRERVWLIGSGETRVNPIHGVDLAWRAQMRLKKRPERSTWVDRRR